MPDVFFFTSQANRATTAKLRDSYEGVCRKRGWNFQPRMLDPIKTAEGRPVLPVPPAVAMGLYPRTHRQRVATLVLGTDPIVPLRPNQTEAIRHRHTVPLRQFIDYKACWIRVPNEPTNLTWAGMFEAWCDTIDCEGEHDPRCLPFHVFAGEGAGLKDPNRRQAFNQRYGAGAKRIDDENLNWLLEPRLFESTESDCISGYVCRAGFHWEVSGVEWRISTPAGIWEGEGHVNVYPNAHIRAKGNNVRKIV